MNNFFKFKTKWKPQFCFIERRDGDHHHRTPQEVEDARCVKMILFFGS